MEFRSVVAAEEPGATEYTYEGKTVFLSPPRVYEMTVFPTVDQLGKPALGFTPTAQKREEFGDYTESLKRKRLAVLVDGEILTLPEVNARLGNGGVIEGGRGGFTPEELTELIAKIQSGSSY